MGLESGPSMPWKEPGRKVGAVESGIPLLAMKVAHAIFDVKL
jgi:hypothetical protein